MAEITVTDNPASSRFEARVDGVLAGFADYQLTDELVVFTHTEVEPTFEGRGVGSALARAALDQLRADGGRKALPVCPFIRGYIESRSGQYPESAEPRVWRLRNPRSGYLLPLQEGLITIGIRVAEGLAVSRNTANDAVLAEGKQLLINDPRRRHHDRGR